MEFDSGPYAFVMVVTVCHVIDPVTIGAGFFANAAGGGGGAFCLVTISSINNGRTFCEFDPPVPIAATNTSRHIKTETLFTMIYLSC